MGLATNSPHHPHRGRGAPSVRLRWARGKVSPGVLHDNQLGTIVWMQKSADCEDSVSQVYLGPAKIYEFRGGKPEEELDLGNSIVILDDDIGTQDRSKDV